MGPSLSLSLSRLWRCCCCGVGVMGELGRSHPSTKGGASTGINGASDVAPRVDKVGGRPGL
jgi:hypothetical protein